MEVRTVSRTRFAFHHVTFKVQLAEVSLKDFQKLWDSPSFRKQSLVFLVLGEGIMLVRECGLFCLGSLPWGSQWPLVITQTTLLRGAQGQE